MNTQIPEIQKREKSCTSFEIRAHLPRLEEEVVGADVGAGVGAGVGAVVGAVVGAGVVAGVGLGTGGVTGAGSSVPSGQHTPM